MKLIPLTQGKFAQVDNEDYEFLIKSAWYAQKDHTTYYNNYKAIHLGYFESEIDAAKAYNKAASEYFGEFARLNIIE